MAMLIIDGVKYNLWKPADEKQLEEMVKEHAKEIFGKSSVYFDLKQKLTSKVGIVSIPDGYVISLSKPFEWFIVEEELSGHPLHEHITNQLNKFVTGIKNLYAQKELADSLYDKIDNDKPLRVYTENMIGSLEIKGFLYDLISKPPKVVVVIEEKGDEVKEACDGLKVEPIVVEFKTYVRENAENVHAHLFEPLTETISRSKKGINEEEIEGKVERIVSDDIKNLLRESINQLKQNNCVIKPLEGRWMSVWIKGKRFMYIATRNKWFLCQIKKTDGWKSLRIKNKKEWENAFQSDIQPILNSIK